MSDKAGDRLLRRQDRSRHQGRRNAWCATPGRSPSTWRSAIRSGPLFGGAIGRGVSQAFNTWVDRALVAGDAAGHRLPTSTSASIRRDDAVLPPEFEGFLKSTLEEARAGRDRGAAPPRARGSSRCRRRSSASRYVCGAAPAYGDYILLLGFQWARVTSPQDVLDPRTRCAPGASACSTSSTASRATCPIA